MYSTKKEIFPCFKYPDIFKQEHIIIKNNDQGIDYVTIFKVYENFKINS